MKNRFIMPLMAMLALLSSTALGDRLVLAADTWCPFNCEPDSDRPGYLIEATERALAHAGHTIVYRTMPWSRAIRQGRVGAINALVGAGPTEVPDFIFPRRPLAIARHTFFTLPESEWSFTDYDTLHAITLGIIDSYSYGNMEEIYIEPNRHNRDRLVVVSGDRVIGRLIEMLDRGRIDAFVEEKAVVSDYLRHSATNRFLRSAGIIHREPIYIAFSPVNPNSERYARQLANGLEEMRESGELRRIASRYSIELHD